jgi:hypothetical protein
VGSQSTIIPTARHAHSRFLKTENLSWEFVGQFRVEAMTQNAIEIQIHRERHHVADIGSVLFLHEG